MPSAAPSPRSAAGQHGPRSSPRSPARAEGAAWRIGPLTTYADPQAMRDWLENAEAGSRIVYATGPVLGDHAAVRLITAWQQAGSVHLFQRRAERANCTDYCAEKRPVKVPAPAPSQRAGMGKASRADMARLSRHLRRLAALGRPCPSFSDLARTLDLPRGNRGRRRAQYLLDQLAREGRVLIERNGKEAQIVIPNARTGKGPKP